MTAAFGWHSIFIALFIMAVAILIAVHFLLPEKPSTRYVLFLKPSTIIRGFATVAKEPQFYTYAFAGSIAAAGLYGYIAGSPYVFMELFHVTEKQYGWIFAMVAGGLITCSQINSINTVVKNKSEQIIVVALLCQSAFGLTLVIGSAFNLLDVYATIGLCFGFLSCQGFTFPNTSALSLAPFSRMAGSASALLGCIQLGIGAITSAMVSYLSNNTAIPMTVVMATCALTALTIAAIGSSKIRKKAAMADVQQQSADMMITS